MFFFYNLCSSFSDLNGQRICFISDIYLLKVDSKVLNNLIRILVIPWNIEFGSDSGIIMLFFILSNWIHSLWPNYIPWYLILYNYCLSMSSIFLILLHIFILNECLFHELIVFLYFLVFGLVVVQLVFIIYHLFRGCWVVFLAFWSPKWGSV